MPRLGVESLSAIMVNPHFVQLVVPERGFGLELDAMVQFCLEHGEEFRIGCFREIDRRTCRRFGLCVERRLRSGASNHRQSREWRTANKLAFAGVGFCVRLNSCDGPIRGTVKLKNQNCCGRLIRPECAGIRWHRRFPFRTFDTEQRQKQSWPGAAPATETRATMVSTMRALRTICVCAMCAPGDQRKSQDGQSG
jgi:hypothetical protein